MSSPVLGRAFILVARKMKRAFNILWLNLGYFTNKNDAIKARLNGEVKYFGEFSSQKHLYEQYGIDEPKDGETNG